MAATGLPENLARRLYDAWELPRPQPGQALRADEDELLQLAAPALAAFGRDETSLLAMQRTVVLLYRRHFEHYVLDVTVVPAELAARLVEIVHELANRHGGRPVKLLGDGVMFHFPEPAQQCDVGWSWSTASPGSACRRPGSACTSARWSSRTATTSAAPSTSRPGSPTTSDRGRSSLVTRSSPTSTVWKRSALSLSGRSRSRG